MRQRDFRLLAATQHACQLNHTGFVPDGRDRAQRLLARQLLAHQQVVVGTRRHLGQVGHGQHLAVLAELAQQPPEVMAARREEAADLERSTLLATLAHGAVLNGVHLALVVFIGHGCRYHFANIGDGRQVDDPFDIQVHGVVVLLGHRLVGDRLDLIGEGERGHTDQCKNQ